MSITRCLADFRHAPFVCALAVGVTLFSLSACGSDADESGEPAAGGSSAAASEIGNWTGTVTILMPDPSQGIGAMIPVLTLDGDLRCALLMDEDVVVEGIESNRQGVVWDLGKTYSISGCLVTDPAELEAARQLGCSRIIRASSIILLDR